MTPAQDTPDREPTPGPNTGWTDVRRQSAFLLGLLLVTLVTLALEVLFTRLLSVLTWYSLAFLVIAMGLFGLTAGAVRVYLRPKGSDEETLASLARDTRWLALAIPASCVLLLVVPLRVAPALTTVFLFLVFAGILALPFIAAGMVVATALTRTPLPIGRVYAVDLAGAALGAALVPLVLDRMSAGAAILAMGVLAAVASLAFGFAARNRNDMRRAMTVGAAVLGLALVQGGMRDGLVPIWVKGRPEDRNLLDIETWNSHSRIQVSRPIDAPGGLWGAGSRCSAPMMHQRLIVIDGDAATPVFYLRSGFEDLRFLECDVTNLAHQIRPDGPAAVIGVGGSRDVQAALMFGHRPVTGIEFNRKLLAILRGHVGQGTGVPGHPDVKLVDDEARSYLTRTPDRFRIIQASLIDTWASTGAGAHALGENGLYTLEAWRIFLDRLEPNGVFTVSRWASGETARLVSLASAALLDAGASRPEDHVILARGGSVTTLILARSPFTRDDIDKIGRACDERGFELLLAPGMPPKPGSLNPWLQAANRSALDQLTLSGTLDFRAPTDDRPFFFNVVRPRAFWHPAPAGTAVLIEGNQAATFALVFSFFASVVLSILAIAVPLSLRKRTSPGPHQKPWAGLAYFALVGVGFMLFEIGILQRSTVLLGHPDLSLRVVLASLVGSAAIGAWLSDKLPLDRSPFCFLYPAAIASSGFALAVLLPSVLSWAQPLGEASRISVAVAVCGGAGTLLGMAFPAGMRLVRQRHGDQSPWFWGINGVGSVVASSLAVIIALEWGLRWLFAVSAICYLALIPTVLWMRQTGKPIDKAV